MTLNGVIAVLLRYFIELHSFAVRLRHRLVEDRPIMSEKYCLTVTFGQNDPRSSRMVSATAKLLVQSYTLPRTGTCPACRFEMPMVTPLFSYS